MADTEFEDALKGLINRHSQENASNTPDWILAQYMGACLAAWNTGVQQRETWYGRDARPGSMGGESQTPPKRPLKQGSPQKVTR